MPHAEEVAAFPAGDVAGSIERLTAEVVEINAFCFRVQVSV